MMASYFTNNTGFKLALVLLDGRRTLTLDDKEIINYLFTHQIPFYLVITKTDKLNQSENALNKHLNEYHIPAEQVFYTSSVQPKTLVSLQKAIEKIFSLV